MLGTRRRDQHGGPQGVIAPSNRSSGSAAAKLGPAKERVAKGANWIKVMKGTKHGKEHCPNRAGHGDVRGPMFKRNSYTTKPDWKCVGCVLGVASPALATQLAKQQVGVPFEWSPGAAAQFN